MPDSSPPAPSPLIQQAFQGILARNVTNNYMSLPVRYHQPTGTRYIPMSVLRSMYPDIIRLQVDGQTIEPRRGLPTVQSMFQSVLSQWIDETSMGSDAKEGEGSNTSYAELVDESASSSFVVVAQDNMNTVVGTGGDQESQVMATNTFDNGGINSSLLSEPTSQALSDDDANESTIEWIEYRPDSVIQVVYYTSDPVETTPGSASGSQAGTGMTGGDYPSSFWARIRQEIQTAVRQIYQELTEEKAQEYRDNSNYCYPAAAARVASLSPTSSWIAPQQNTNQARPPSEHSVISLSSSPSPATGSQGSGSGSQSDDMDENAAAVTEPTNTRSMCRKDKKRDRDEKDVDALSLTSSGSEKRLRSSTTSPISRSSPTGDEGDGNEGLVSQKSSAFKDSSRSLSGGAEFGFGPDSEPIPGTSSGSIPGSSTSGAVSSGSSPGSGSSKQAEFHRSGSGSPPVSSSRATFDTGSGSFGLLASLGIPGSPPGLGSSSTPGSPSESYATAGPSAITPESRTPSASLEVLVPPLLRGKRPPAMDPESDELNQEDTVMITADRGVDQSDIEIISIDSNEDNDIDDDDTQPLRFIANQLRDFVARRKGLLVGELQAVTICLKTSKEARQFYRFLKSQDYFGTWLNIKLAWTWDREQLGELVEALIVSPIQILFLDGCVGRATSAAAAASAAVPDTSVSSLTVASTSQEGGNQSVDSNTRTRRYDPLVRLFRHNRFKELHFYGLPNLLHHSIAPIPWDLSHLRVFRLQARISEWEGAQANRFLQLVKRATNLEHLYIDCPTDRYKEYVDEITRAMNQSERNKNSPPLDIHFQHHQHRHTLLRVRYDQLDCEFKEFEVDLMGISHRFHIQWKAILDQLVDGTLVSLSLNNMLDETWMDMVMEWIHSQANDRGVGLENLQLDCMHFGPTQFQGLVDLLELTQPRLQTLDLRNVYISFFSNVPSSSETSAAMLDRDVGSDITHNDAVASVPMIDWPTLVSALNISVLVILRIRTSNLQDRDIDGVIDCLKGMVRNSKKLALEKVLLQGAQLSIKGERTLVGEIQAILPGVDVKFR
ncbi:hypothetical protein BG015_002131 [Linnemannia schmuckeri]|uniref:Uncharacterized protein n=1 Tax=Linnemannia schmuckeri TaxID=64567 RepID=A0A9P5RNY5_9FUNG|nr:hypothetical protein BG015_002131 [Linnemannia schmuckeri]